MLSSSNCCVFTGEKWLLHPRPLFITIYVIDGFLRINTSINMKPAAIKATTTNLECRHFQIYGIMQYFREYLSKCVNKFALQHSDRTNMNIHMYVNGQVFLLVISHLAWLMFSNWLHQNQIKVFFRIAAAERLKCIGKVIAGF